MQSLYIHIPFCIRKCRYCDFYSIATDTHPDGQQVAGFLDGIEHELAMLPPVFQPTTIYIGGGTPTALTPAHLEQLLLLLTERFDPRIIEEFTCEANPGTLDSGKLAMLAAHGINRLSLGAQSFTPATLEFLGRIHSASDIERTTRLSRKQGIRNIGIDLIYGLPAPGGQHLEHDLEQVLDLRPEHLSCYCLSIEPDTPLHKNMIKKAFKPASDEKCRAEYDYLCKKLVKSGYHHYEISNFSLPGRESLHNQTYWLGMPYFGVGPAAHSFWNNRRHANPANLAAWLAPLRQQRTPWIQSPYRAPDACARELLVMALRLTKGVDITRFEKQTGFTPESLAGEAIASLIEIDMLEYQGHHLRLTPQALFVSNSVLERII